MSVWLNFSDVLKRAPSSNAGFQFQTAGQYCQVAYRLSVFKYVLYISKLSVECCCALTIPYFDIRGI